MISPEDFLEEIGSKVIDVSSICIEACSIEIVALLHKLSQLIIDTHKLIGRIRENIGCDRQLLGQHIEVLLIDLQEQQYNFIAVFLRFLEDGLDDLEVDGYVCDHDDLLFASTC